MGFLDALLGNASEVDKSEVAEELAPILAENEQIDRVYKLIRDMYVFTNKRLLLIDKQGVTGRKVEYHSIPYRAITQFKVETAGHFDMDAELRIWISGSSEPLKKELKKNTAVGIQRSLANWMFN
ncbi:PH domain-containing protein [Bowmanella pacifica]|uniref:Bacterial Pleckstrin homology domain-containing protein n=1 Tax=Bowmanella pacifica TaxID=502051 RepID=A0A917YS58_9ALTE|nr:PH domain-containing protein [Bowmanella pacifica]GGO64119.1 hypothetical protein GCM10010982_02770 [Bowmanella pacifica]